jgi:hypothetical protein
LPSGLSAIPFLTIGLSKKSVLYPHHTRVKMAS